MLTPLENHAREAVQQFAGAVTVPILYPQRGELLPIGTGTFFAIASRLFVVTAAHLFKDRSLDHFFMPTRRENGKALRVKGTVVRAPKTPEIDVAVIEILDSDTKAILESGWKSLTLENTSSANQEGTFILCGYPTAYQNEVGDGNFEYGVMTAFTTKLGYVPANANEPIDEDLDLFFEFGPTAREHDGTAVTTPRLHGASGASVWEYTGGPAEGLWLPANAVKVIGIQSSAYPCNPPHEWFRAKSWDAVRDALA